MSLPLSVSGQPLLAGLQKLLRLGVTQALANRLVRVQFGDRMLTAKAGRQKPSGPNVPQILSQLPTRR
jgi:hypothetical protein